MPAMPPTHMDAKHWGDSGLWSDAVLSVSLLFSWCMLLLFSFSLGTVHNGNNYLLIRGYIYIY